MKTKELSRGFEQLESQELDLGNCNIDVKGATAVASCRGQARFVPKVGRKTSHVENREWTFNLQRLGGTWLIESVIAVNRF